MIDVQRWQKEAGTIPVVVLLLLELTAAPGLLGAGRGPAGGPPTPQRGAPRRIRKLEIIPGDHCRSPYLHPPLPPYFV